MEDAKWAELEPRLKNTLEELQAQHSRGSSKALWRGLLIGFALFLFMGAFASTYHIFLLIGNLLFGWMACSMYYYSQDNQKYKSEVMPRLVDAICPGATYSAKGTIPEKLIENARLYDVGWGEKYDNEDTIRGKVGRTDFVYGEVELYHMQSNGKTTQKVVDFKGFVFDADFNKEFQGITILSSERFRLSNHVGFFSKLKRCKLEDVNFEKAYRTYTTNDQEARYILTPALQQRIMEMNRVFAQQLHDSDISISFHEDRMTIMVPSDTNRFEVKYDLEGVKKDFLALSIMMDIVEMMNLNLRIWTKE